MSSVISLCCPACYQKDMSADLVEMERCDYKDTWICPKCEYEIDRIALYERGMK